MTIARKCINAESNAYQKYIGSFDPRSRREMSLSFSLSLCSLSRKIRDSPFSPSRSVEARRVRRIVCSAKFFARSGKVGRVGAESSLFEFNSSFAELRGWPGGPLGTLNFAGPQSGESKLSMGTSNRTPRPPPEGFNLATREEMIASVVAAIREQFSTRSTLLSRSQSIRGSMHRKAEHLGFRTRLDTPDMTRQESKRSEKFRIPREEERAKKRERSVRR